MKNTDDHYKENNPKPKSKGIAGVIFFFVIGFIISTAIGWVVFPDILYSKKKQPIDFNHSLHMKSVDQGCESCHFFRPDGSYAGSPKIAQCVNCHSSVQGSDPEEAKFVNEYVSKGVEVPWLIYSRQPNCVFFSHTAHVKKAKMDCVVCHGNIGESTNLKVYEKNRISGYSRDIWGKDISGLFKKNSWDSMKMADCAACHESAKIKRSRLKSVQTKKDGCLVCHK